MISSHAHRSTFAFSAQLSCTLHAHIPLTAVQFTITCMSRRLRAHDQHAATRPRRGRDAPKQRPQRPRRKRPACASQPARAATNCPRARHRAPLRQKFVTPIARVRLAALAASIARHCARTGSRRSCRGCSRCALGDDGRRQPGGKAIMPGGCTGARKAIIAHADSCSRRQCQCEWPTEMAAATALAATVSLSCHVPAAIFSESCPGSTRTLWPTTCHQ